jgi:hypothetical protein
VDRRRRLHGRRHPARHGAAPGAHTDLLKPYPGLTAYDARAFARPAWQRTKSAYAARLGMNVADLA